MKAYKELLLQEGYFYTSTNVKRMFLAIKQEITHDSRKNALDVLNIVKKAFDKDVEHVPNLAGDIATYKNALDPNQKVLAKMLFRYFQVDTTLGAINTDRTYKQLLPIFKSLHKSAMVV